MDVQQLLLVGLAAAFAGLVNALAGGGTLITFPALVAVGLPAVAANVTSTVALCPGYLGGALAQRRDLKGQARRLALLVPAGLIGGALGAALLLSTPERRFRAVVPWLILGGSGLLAVQERLRARIARHAGPGGRGAPLESLAALPVALAAIYGGYFGAGLSVIVLAALALLVDDSLTRLNAVKQTIALAANLAAALLFCFSGSVRWSAALAMMLAALLGGAAGGRLAGRIAPAALRITVVCLGVAVGAFYLARG